MLGRASLKLFKDRHSIPYLRKKYEKWKLTENIVGGASWVKIVLRFSWVVQEVGLCWWFLRILADSFYNRCYGAPVQACSLAPSKLQTRSTGFVPTPRSSHSMRFPVTAIIKSASFFEIIYVETQLNWVYFYRSTRVLVLLLVVFVCMDTLNNFGRRACWRQGNFKGE